MRGHDADGRIWANPRARVSTGWCYIIVYEISGEDRLDILAVWHSAQDKP